MKISVIQSEEKFLYKPWDPGEYDLELCRRLAQTGIDESFELMETAAKEGTQLIITIEGFNRTINPCDPRYNLADVVEPLDGPLMERFCKLAGKYEIYIVGGLFTSRGGKAYNSGVLFCPDGHIAGIYDKVHLPAGEYPYFSYGDTYPVFETEYGNIGILICWDMQYPEAAREITLAGADLIACPTWGWENIYGLCRAYENSVTIAAAMAVPYGEPIWDFCNPSCIVDNMGRIIAAGSRTGSQIITAETDIRKDPLPQYGAGGITGLDSMRQIRLIQRRPETYRNICAAFPPLMDRYNK